MIVLMVEKQGLSTGMKAAIFLLGVTTAFLLGIMWGRPELVEDASKLILV